MIIKVILVHFDVYCSVHLRPEGGFSMAMLVSGNVCGSFLLVNPVAAARISLGSKKAVFSESGRLFVPLQDPIDWRLVYHGAPWCHMAAVYPIAQWNVFILPFFDGLLRCGKEYLRKKWPSCVWLFLLEKLLPKFQRQS